jgi:REP element-mobilizing transposase RayT
MAKPTQLLLIKPRGGARRGAGRPPKGLRAGSPHKARPKLAARFPVHVILRVSPTIGSLRRHVAFRAFRTATLVAARRTDFRIIQLSLQRTHVHLIVEADNEVALAKGMQGFQVSAAKHLNAAIGAGASLARRRGCVFTDRYYAVAIKSPRQARNVLSYVMNNWRHHREDRAPGMERWKIDWLSSASAFAGWAEYDDVPMLWRGPARYEPLAVSPPRTWLLRDGWKKHGATISCYEVPARA